jgi:hypothetical protein
MKKLILFAVLYCMLSGSHAASIVKSGNHTTATVSATERAKAHFKENYADEVQNSAWYTSPDNSIYCIFQRGNTMNRVFYDSRGYWQFTLVSYQPSELNMHIRQQVSDQFEGYRITYVNEIQSAYDEPIYMINLENAGNIKVVKVMGDDIEVKQTLVKE